MEISVRTFLAVAGIWGALIHIGQAQTNVTMYGVVDLGINYVNNIDNNSLVTMASGHANGSRLGFKGVEDLGGGLSALFQLESGFFADTGHSGQGGRAFGRQSFIGLNSNDVGTLTLGRQYDSVGNYPGAFTANNSWGGVLYTHPFDNDTSGSFRLENSIVYTSPTLAGITFGGTLALGERPGAFKQHLTYSLGARYQHGPWTLAIAYIDLDHPGMRDREPVDEDTGSLSNDNVNFRSAQQKTYGIGTAYAAGPAIINLTYFYTKINKPYSLQSFHEHDENIDTFLQQLSDIQFHNIELNSLYKLMPAITAGGMYTYTQGIAKNENNNSTVKPVWHTLGTMASYQFSGRTDVYMQFVYQLRSGNQTGTDLDDAHIPGVPGTSSTNKQSVVRVGLRHRF